MSHTARLPFAPLPRGAAMVAAVLVAAAVLTAARQAVALAPLTEHPGLLAVAGTLDATVVLTLPCWRILGRAFGWSALALVPLFLLWLAVAGRVLPEATTALRGLHLAAVPLELAAVAWAVRRVRAPGRLHDALAYEAEVPGTALGGWRRPDLPAGAVSRWSVKLDVPVDRIVAVRVAPGPGLATKPAADLRLALPGAPPVVLELDRPVTAVGIYGLRREVRTLALGLDEPGRLAALLSRAGAASTPE